MTDALEQCRLCKLKGVGKKPRSEFYNSELRYKSKRCKVCHREGVDGATKNSGRKSNSMSPAEVTWLCALLRAVPSSGLSHMARRPEYAQLSRKITGMVGRIKDREGVVKDEW